MVKHNSEQPHADQQGINFKECRHVSSRVHSKDKLDFVFGSSGIQGSFEIGDLPQSDAMLLLVVGKRDATSSLVSFQSFAFPSHRDGKDAQLAVVDAYKGNSSSPHLRMEDHINGKQAKTISKRVEQLNFNRIYAIEQGTYDVSISDHILQGNLADQLTTLSKRTLQLDKNHNYVILRTGDGKLEDQSLVAFPEVHIHSGVVPTTAVSSMLLALLAMAIRQW